LYNGKPPEILESTTEVNQALQALIPVLPFQILNRAFLGKNIYKISETPKNQTRELGIHKLPLINTSIKPDSKIRNIKSPLNRFHQKRNENEKSKTPMNKTHGKIWRSNLLEEENTKYENLNTNPEKERTKTSSMGKEKGKTAELEPKCTNWVEAGRDLMYDLSIHPHLELEQIRNIKHKYINPTAHTAANAKPQCKNRNITGNRKIRKKDDACAPPCVNVYNNTNQILNHLSFKKRI
jgi:hypothetical protein